MAINPTETALQFSNLKHHAVAFDKIDVEAYVPCLQEALTRARANIEKIKATSAAPTFENTIVALESAGEDSELISTIFFNQLGANTNDRMQALAREIGPILSNHASDI